MSTTPGTDVLANLLPGIRELRAPLAAGYIWLVALWVSLEPVVPREEEADGLLLTLYRLADSASAIGIGVTVSFVAYLLGSLSATLLSPALARRFGGGVRLPQGVPALSDQGQATLDEISRTAHAGLEQTLAMSGTDVDRLLQDFLEPAPGSTGKIQPRVGWLPRLRWTIRSWLQRNPRAGRPLVITPSGGIGTAAPVDFESAEHQALAKAIVRDLDVIAKVRLLGKDQELYSALERLRAEVEFRLAIVPPLVVAGAAMAARGDSPWSVAVVVAALALVYGILLDAAQLQRRMNEDLLDVLMDGRVQAPTIERLQKRAAAIAGRGPIDEVEQDAGRAAAAIRDTMKRLHLAGRSEPTLAYTAQAEARKVEDVLDGLESSLPSRVIEPGRQAARLLAELADAWVAVIEGHGFDIERAGTLLTKADESYRAFLSGVRANIADMRELRSRGEDTSSE